MARLRGRVFRDGRGTVSSAPRYPPRPALPSVLAAERVQAEGLPYQALINSVIHKYVTDQMVDRDELRKVIARLAI